jgi:galactonate dehydratase
MSDLRITDVETEVVANPWKPWVYIRLDSNKGLTGYGEATYRPHQDVVAAIENVADELVGMDPFETERLFTPRSPLTLKNGPHIARHMSVLSGIDMAMWDLKGKYLDVPVYDLLGGAVHGTQLRTYANGWYTTIYEDGERQPDRFGEAAQRVVEKGYDALKFDPFGTAWRQMDKAERNRSIDCVRAVREAVGDDVDILIEGHKRFSVATAMEIANRLEPFEPTWFEEPVPQDINALKKIADSSPVPIATGETMVSHRSFPDLLHDTAIGINQADVVHAGGITQLKKIAAMSDAEHVDLAPHCSSGWLTLVASLHVNTSSPNFFMQENFVDFAYADWAEDILTNPPTVEDGSITIPDGPGLGTSLDWEMIKESHTYEENKDDIHTINLYEKGWEERNKKKQ